MVVRPVLVVRLWLPPGGPASGLMGRRKGWQDQARERADRSVAKRQAEHDELVLPRIRQLREDGAGWGTIADVLNLDGLPTPRPGGTWSSTAVRRIGQRHGLVVERGAVEVRLAVEQAWAVGDLIAEVVDWGERANQPVAAEHHRDRLLAARAIIRRALTAEARH